MVVVEVGGGTWEVVVAVPPVDAGGEVRTVPGPAVPVPTVPPIVSEVDDSPPVVVAAPVPELEPGIGTVVSDPPVAGWSPAESDLEFPQELTPSATPAMTIPPAARIHQVGFVTTTNTPAHRWRLPADRHNQGPFSLRTAPDVLESLPRSPRSYHRHGGAQTTRLPVVLTTFGVAALVFMMIMYALERRGPLFTLAFAAGCALASCYGFLAGAWPFGAVEAVWSGVALSRFRARRRSGDPG